LAVDGQWRLASRAFLANDPGMRAHALAPLVLFAGFCLAQEPAVQEPAAGAAPAAKAPVDFSKQVAPLLVQRCIECHGPKLQKGDLRLDSREAVFPKGAEDSWTVTPGTPEESELVHRIELPLGDEDIMPNKGEPLTKPQQELLRQWVAEGAHWDEAGDKAIADALAAQVLPKITFDLPEVDAAQQAAIDKAIEALREKGAVVQQVAADTRAVDVNFSLLRDKVGDAELAMCEPLAPVLVWLNVSRTAVTDAGCKRLAGFAQLRRLHAANTAISDAGFQQIAGLAHLEYVNAYGTGLSDAGLVGLAGLAHLKQVYAWQSKVTADGKKALLAKLPTVQVDLGDYVEERLAAAQKEISDRESRNKPVNEMCPVLDKPIDAALFVDYEGRRIAFCCAKCKAAFQKDPKKYLEKLPK
jgi:mono/diheme cytochrome c family protein/YHS domain-containing protein